MKKTFIISSATFKKLLFQFYDYGALLSARHALDLVLPIILFNCVKNFSAELFKLEVTNDNEIAPSYLNTNN